MTISRGPVRAPDLIELETLVACAAEGSLVAAATRLDISRPAVAKRIANLEVLAGRSLLQRGSRGVRLTDAGATLLAGARRMLDERDQVVRLLGEMRGEGPSAIAGLRELLGHAPDTARAAQQSEARLAETERVLELVLRASETGVAISDPDTAVIYEVNDAFCRFVGRSRAELIGKPATAIGTWCDVAERSELIAELRRTGKAERVLIRVRRPDGTMRAGETSASLVSLAGSTQVLSTIDDVTETRRAALERDGTRTAYRAVGDLAAQVLTGKTLHEAIAQILPALRRCGEFTTAVLWHPGSARAAATDGEPTAKLAEYLAKAQGLPGQDVMVFSPREPDVAEIGFVVPLPAMECLLVLLSARPLPDTTQTLVVELLSDLATIVSAACSSGEARRWPPSFAGDEAQDGALAAAPLRSRIPLGRNPSAPEDSRRAPISRGTSRADAPLGPANVELLP